MAEKTIFSQASLSFTLPISCQICLCKVKEPLVCPNQHVFCTQCMQVWLEHNQHCPSCRVPITPDTPCKQIIGGPAPSSITCGGRFSTPALRKVRFEMMYKEYEDEITKLSDEMKSLKERNESLEARLEELNKGASDQAAPPTTSNPRPADGDGSRPSTLEPKPNEQIPSLVKLTKNLEVAAETYKQVRSDMDHLKQVNTKLKDENTLLLRDNGRLKQDIVTRSPKKYEKFVAAAEHNRLLQCEKQVKQLRKALERSDNYIEELEKQLEITSSSTTEKGDGDDGCIEKITGKFIDLSAHVQNCGQSYPHDTGPRRHGSPTNSSFLEQPSPITPSSGLSKLCLNTANDQSTSRRNCNRQLKFDTGEGQERSASSGNYSNTTFGNLDYTLTDELSDCAKLMKEAAHRLDAGKERAVELSEGGMSSIDGYASEHFSRSRLSIEHPYSVISKTDFGFGQQSQPSCSSSNLNYDESNPSLPTNSNDSVGLTVETFKNSNDDSFPSTNGAFTTSSNSTSNSFPDNVSRCRIPGTLYDVTPSTSGAPSSSERKLFGMPQRVYVGNDGDGTLKRKTGDDYKVGVSSPSKTTKSE